MRTYLRNRRWFSSCGGLAAAVVVLAIGGCANSSGESPGEPPLTTGSGPATPPPTVGTPAPPPTNATAAMEFEPVAAMSVARAAHTATRLDDGQVLIAGGDASAELFDPADAAFVPTGSLTGTGRGIAAVRLGTGRVLIVGGTALTTETYDPATGIFQPSGPLQALHVTPTATLLADGRVLVAGGTDGISTKGLAVASAELFDTQTGTSTSVPSMASARVGHAAVALTDGTVLLVGGRNGYAPDSADDPPWDPMFGELFDPALGHFTRAGDMGTTRVGAEAVALPDGRALVIGGFGNWWQNVHEQPASPPFAQVYVGSSRTFVSLSTSRVAERGFTATPLPDGRLVLIGGVNDGRSLDTVSLLDPETGVLTAIGHLTGPRAEHTATLLADGRILVTGGVDGDGNVLASAEISRARFGE